MIMDFVIIVLLIAVLIFLCVGSREYQFDRLIRQVDMLIEKGIITQGEFDKSRQEILKHIEK